MAHICILLMVLFIKTGAMAAACSFRTDLLQRMAEAMGIADQVLQLGDGEYDHFATYRQRPVVVIVSRNEVTHIGYTLFTSTQRRSLNSPACNFIERYALEITLPLKRERSVARQLDEDGIFLRGGTFETLKQIQGDTTYAVSVENLSDRRYTVSWSKEGKVFLAVNFPIEHDLLVGTSMLENERRITETLPQQSKAARQVALADSMLLKLTWQAKYYVLPGDSFYTRQLNNNRYYERSAEAGGYTLAYNKNFLVESLSNLMTTAAIDNDYDLQVRIVKYGFVQDTLHVKLNQWLNYCLDQGATPYFGMIAIDRNLADCELMMWNRAMGYVHVMRMEFDIETLEDRKGLIKARLNCYVPTTRTQYLFDELKK